MAQSKPGDSFRASFGKRAEHEILNRYYPTSKALREQSKLRPLKSLSERAHLAIVADSPFFTKAEHVRDK
jgi:hypothetical protein